jgi:transketolase
MAEKLGLKMGRANLDEVAATLLELAKTDRRVIAVTSDSRGSGKLGPFGQALPKQLVEVGIAEQNLVGITAGLAACGKKSFGVSPASSPRVRWSRSRTMCVTRTFRRRWSASAPE